MTRTADHNPRTTPSDPSIRDDRRASVRARANFQVTLVTPSGTPTTPTDRATLDFIRSELLRNWHSTTIYSRGARFEADTLPAFVALVDGRPAAHLTFNVDHHGLEVITLASALERQGLGTALMDRAEAEARARGAARLFLTTTNDNLDALRFYQRRGMHIAQIHRGIMDRYRNAGEPIRAIGKHGIPIRDEIELEIAIKPHGPLDQ